MPGSSAGASRPLGPAPDLCATDDRATLKPRPSDLATAPARPCALETLQVRRDDLHRAWAAGREWARHRLFGPDSRTGDARSDFQAGVASAAAGQVTALGQAAHRLDHFASAAGELGGLIAAAADQVRGRGHLIGETLRAEPADAADRPFTVVLMGRTMAGKSTLFEFLSGGSGERVGDGRQRYSRDACARTSDLLDFIIVDTPGVGALDGEDDYRKAFDEVPGADLILWVATDQATQEQTGGALERLAALGKPIVVALNCLTALDDEDDLLDFLDAPDQVFAETDGNLAPIARHLASAGGHFIRAVPIHAQAALWSSTESTKVSIDAAFRVRLREISRIDELVGALRDERDHSAPQRRVISSCDRVRNDLFRGATEMAEVRQRITTQVASGGGAAVDFENRAWRRIDDARDQLTAAMVDILARRERWHESIDIGTDVTALWRTEVEKIHSEMQGASRDIADQLRLDLESLSADVAEDWAEFEQAGFGGLPGGGAWMNRAAKIGGRLACAAGVGLVVGGPVGAAAGLAVGLLGNVAIQFADRFIDATFRGKAEVRKRRQAQVSASLRPLIDQLRASTTSAINSFVDGWHGAITAQIATRTAQVSELENALADVVDLEDSLVRAVAHLDLMTSREILRLCGRTRAAAATYRATRWPGVGFAVELPEPDFSELFLFPIADAVETMIPVTGSPAFPASAALQIVLGLCAREVTVMRIAANELTVAVSDPTPEGVRASWQALVSSHVRVRTSITQGESR